MECKIKVLQAELGHLNDFGGGVSFVVSIVAPNGEEAQKLKVALEAFLVEATVQVEPE